MPTINPSQLSNGLRIELNDDVWMVVEFQHVKPGKGGAFVRSKLKSLTSGKVVDHTFRTEKIELADVEFRKMQFSYREDEALAFMDLETYEQLTMPEDVVGDAASYILEGDEASVMFWRGNPAGMQIPDKVDLKVVETMPGEKGNTVNTALKPAKLETGITVQVPMFINEGDTVRVDTRDGKYEERV